MSVKLQEKRWKVKGVNGYRFVEMQKSDVEKCVQSLPQEVTTAITRRVTGWDSGYVAGGFCRDVIRGAIPKDIDYFPNIMQYPEPICPRCRGRKCMRYEGLCMEGILDVIDDHEYAVVSKCMPELQIIKQPRFLGRTAGETIAKFDCTVNAAAIWYRRNKYSIMGLGKWVGIVHPDFYHDLHSSQLRVINEWAFRTHRAARMTELGFHVPDEFMAELVLRELTGEESEMPEELEPF